MAWRLSSLHFVGVYLCPVISCLQSRTTVFAAVRAQSWHCLTNTSLPLCLSRFSLAHSDNNITVFHWLSLPCHFLSLFHHFPSCLSVTDTSSLSPYRSPLPSFPTVIPISSSLPFLLTAVPQHQWCNSLQPSVLPYTSTSSLLLLHLLFVDIDSCHGALMW